MVKLLFFLVRTFGAKIQKASLQGIGTCFNNAMKPSPACFGRPEIARALVIIITTFYCAAGRMHD
ncbi:MAG: hypothetical protein ACTSXP_04780 [Promethearchaeota archaeon]